MIDKEEQKALILNKEENSSQDSLTIKEKFSVKTKLNDPTKSAVRLCRVYCLIAVFIILLLLSSLVVAFYASNQDEEILWTIMRPESDRRNYKSFMLNNNMKVLLISDPDSEVSAASLSVWTGKK
jgi:hypothetical protein